MDMSAPWEPLAVPPSRPSSPAGSSSLALALWKLRLVVALLFFAIIIASAMRPSIDWLARHRIPRPAGLALHYLALLGAIAVAIAFATPRALDQVNHALSPSGKAEIAREAKQSSGIKHDVLTAAPETTEAPAEALGAREAGDRRSAPRRSRS